MGAWDAVLTVGFGVCGALNSALGVAMLVLGDRWPVPRARQGRTAPRLAASVHLFLGLAFVTMALSRVLFERGSGGDTLLFVAGMAFAATGAVTGILWCVRFFGAGATGQPATDVDHALPERGSRSGVARP